MQKPFSRVLLVDDDDISNYLTSKVVSGLNIAEEIVVLKNGMQALEFFRTQCVLDDQNQGKSDLVLLDINMAVMNGFELMQALHHTDFLDNLKVVILSSSNDPKDVDEAAQFRISGYLTKPLNAEKLNEIIKSL